MGTLCQIRRGFRAEWRDLTFLVEGETARWTVSVRRASDHRPLYKAERSGIGAARIAGVEFGIFLRLGPASSVIPSQLAGQLDWREYWQPALAA